MEPARRAARSLPELADLGATARTPTRTGLSTDSAIGRCAQILIVHRPSFALGSGW
jgi:hypothetical protein